MTRIAAITPPYCASCFQRPKGRCVDFEAAYDGPVIPGSPHIPVDDLVICEDCLGEAFALLDPQGLKETIAELEQIVRDFGTELDAKDKVIQNLRSTTNELAEHPVRNFPGRPKLEGVSEEVRGIINRRRVREGEERRAAKRKAVPA